MWYKLQKSEKTQCKMDILRCVQWHDEGAWYGIKMRYVRYRWVTKKFPWVRGGTTTDRSHCQHILGHNWVPKASQKVTTIPKESSQWDLSNGRGPRAVGSIFKVVMRVQRWKKNQKSYVRHIFGHNSVPRALKKVATGPKESSQWDLSNGMGPRTVGLILNPLWAKKTFFIKIFPQLWFRNYL